MPRSQQFVVFIVDDSPFITRVVGAVISAMGHHVVDDG